MLSWVKKGLAKTTTRSASTDGAASLSSSSSSGAASAGASASAGPSASASSGFLGAGVAAASGSGAEEVGRTTTTTTTGMVDRVVSTQVVGLVWNDEVEKESERRFEMIKAELRAGGWSRAGAYLSMTTEIEFGVGENDEMVEFTNYFQIKGEMTPELAAALDLDTQALHDAMDRVHEATGATIDCLFDICLGIQGDNIVNPKIFDIEGKPSNLLENPQLSNRVLFILFWASYSIPCEIRLAIMEREAQNMKREQWSRDSVALVAISLDEDPHALQTYLAKQHGQSSVHHFWAGSEGWNSDAVQAFGVSSMPFSFIVNRSGTIVWSGMPSELDDVFVDSIQMQARSASSSPASNSIRASPSPKFREKKGTFGEETKKKPLSQFSSEQIRQEIAPNLLTYISQINHSKNGRDPVTALITIEQEWHDAGGNDKDDEKEIVKNIYVSGGIYPTDAEVFEEMGDWLDSLVSNVGWEGCRALIFPDPIAPSVGGCADCGEKLKRSQNVYVCLICEKTLDGGLSPEGIAHGFHRTSCLKCELSKCAKNGAPSHNPSHVVCVVPPGNVDLAGLRFGPGAVRVSLHQQFEHSDPSIALIHPDIACDGCGIPISGIRYKNLVLEDHDLCEKCFTRLDQAEPHDRLKIASEFNCQSAWDVFAKIHTPGCVFISNEQEQLLQHERLESEFKSEIESKRVEDDFRQELERQQLEVIQTTQIRVSTNEQKRAEDKFRQELDLQQVEVVQASQNRISANAEDEFRQELELQQVEVIQASQDRVFANAEDEFRQELELEQVEVIQASQNRVFANAEDEFRQELELQQVEVIQASQNRISANAEDEFRQELELQQVEVIQASQSRTSANESNVPPKSEVEPTVEAKPEGERKTTIFATAAPIGHTTFSWTLPNAETITRMIGHTTYSAGSTLSSQ